MPKRSGMTNAQVAAALATKIAAQVERGAGRGLNAARIFLTARVKETLSVPAPRRRARAKDGTIYYVATVPATPGAPPRKLSGRLRASITSRMVSPTQARIGTNVRYARRHELSRRRPHQFFVPTARKYRAELRRIIGQAVKLEVVTR